MEYINYMYLITFVVSVNDAMKVVISQKFWIHMAALSFKQQV